MKFDIPYFSEMGVFLDASVLSRFNGREFVSVCVNMCINRLYVCLSVDKINE